MLCCHLPGDAITIFFCRVAISGNHSAKAHLQYLKGLSMLQVIKVLRNLLSVVPVALTSRFTIEKSLSTIEIIT